MKRNSDMTRANILIGLSIAILTVGLWAYANRPEEEPVWPKRIQGFSFSPLRADDSPLTRDYPSLEEVDADLALLAGKTNAVRTYTLEADVYTKIPELARKHGINVALGCWIDKDLEKNEREIKTLLKVAGSSRNVVRIIVGNEVLLREEIPVERLIGYLDRVRKAVGVPVSTAEPWHVWLKYPELADHVDYLAVHMLPYWEGVPVERAVDYIDERLAELKAKFPRKPIVIAEVGWPSNGRIRHQAVASEANEAVFLRRFLARAERENYIYYVMEAFDQPWKRDTEGAVGAYWGVYDVYRKPKFPFTEPIVAIPNWRVLAAISVLIAGITLSVLLLDSGTLENRGRSFLAIIAYAAATVAVLIVYQVTDQYLTMTTIVVGSLMMAGMIGVIVVLLTEAHEWAEALWVRDRRRAFHPLTLEERALPMVSIHVPTYNEPPDMVIETLNALARLNYPTYEVLVIDNNTKDPEVWRPVEAHCSRLGDRFRFFHVDPLAGFKAGALNFALARTDPAAEVIAVIDSDYTVDADWLRDLVPQFSNARVAVVQAPQDYRDDRANAFKAMCYAEYQGFFLIGMVTRNDRNAIIEHGTMTMIRRSVMEAIGGWGEWCITEDAELGLRVFEHGHEAVYIPWSYGKGLMPDTFIDYKKQRFRWAYGAVQILRRHAGVLLGLRPSRLTWGQRYHFIGGWLPWMADGACLLFNIGALCWSLAMVVAPKRVDPPMMEFSILPLALFAFKLGKLIYLYRTRVHATIAQTFAAALAGLGLSHTIAKAVWLGVFTKDKPFFRTPKMADTHAVLRAIHAAREETLMLVALLLAAGAIADQQAFITPDLHMWTAVLVIQSIPYLAALVVSLISGFPGLPAGLFGRPKRGAERARPVPAVVPAEGEKSPAVPVPSYLPPFPAVNRSMAYTETVKRR